MRHCSLNFPTTVRLKAHAFFRSPSHLTVCLSAYLRRHFWSFQLLGSHFSSFNSYSTHNSITKPMSNSRDEISSPTLQSHRTSIESLKYANNVSISTQSMVLPPRGTFKSIVLVFTVTFATIINVRRVTGRKRTCFEPIVIDCEFFINFNIYTNNSERVGLANSTTPVDRILLSFKFGKLNFPESYHLHSVAELPL